jgi:hypothetical protein
LAVLSVPDAAVIVYVPNPLPAVAVVVSDGEPLNTLAVSPFAKPEYAAENAGSAPAPYVIEALLAVTVSVALPIVSVPFAKLNV